MMLSMVKISAVFTFILISCVKSAYWESNLTMLLSQGVSIYLFTVFVSQFRVEKLQRDTIKNMKLNKIALGVIVLVIIFAGIVVIKKQNIQNEKIEVADVINQPQMAIDINNIDVSTPEGQKPATGFPLKTELEGEIIENYKNYYKDQNTTQYYITLKVNKEKDVLWEEYQTLVEAEGYLIDEEITNKERGQIAANKEKDYLTITIKPEIDFTTVNISLWDRP